MTKTLKITIGEITKEYNFLSTKAPSNYDGHGTIPLHAATLTDRQILQPIGYTKWYMDRAIADGHDTTIEEDIIHAESMLWVKIGNIR